MTVKIILDGDEYNADWLSSARLEKKAAAGDKEAVAELDRRKSSKMVVMEDPKTQGERK